MTNLELVGLIILFLVTSIVGVVTGSNSLITVPAMFQFGIDEKTAIATNMFGLTFMAVGGTIPFIRQGKIEPRRLSPLIIVTLVGSALGALLVGYITNQSIKLIVSIAMLATCASCTSTASSSSGNSDPSSLSERCTSPMFRPSRPVR